MESCTCVAQELQDKSLCFSSDHVGRQAITFVRASWTARSGSLPSDMAAALKVATPGAGGAGGISRKPSRQ